MSKRKWRVMFNLTTESETNIDTNYLECCIRQALEEGLVGTMVDRLQAVEVTNHNETTV